MLGLAAYKDQHYVPVTYLEAWCNADKQVVTYLKENDEEHKRGKSQKTMYLSHLYTTTTEEFMILNEGELEEIFGELLNLKIEYQSNNEQKELKTVTEFANYYYDYDGWIIKDKNDNLVNKKSIQSRIDEKNNVAIEKGFHLYEDGWNKIRKEIENAVESKLPLSEDVINHLKIYIGVQMWRTPNQLKSVTELTDQLLGFTKEGLGKDYEDVISNLSRAYFLKQLKKYQEGSSSSVVAKQKGLFDNLSVTCYKSVRKLFITSDNPAFFIDDVTFLKGRLNGVVFPISPDLLIRLHRDSSGMKFSSEQLNENDIRRFNKKVKENCVKYYIKI